MRPGKVLIPSIAFISMVGIVGAAFSAWYLGETTIQCASDIESVLTGGGAYGKWVSFKTPDKLVFESGSIDANDLTGGLAFYTRDQEENSITGSIEGTADDQVVASFLRYEEVPSYYDDQVELGISIEITGSLGDYITVRDEYADNAFGFFVPFGSETAKAETSSVSSSSLDTGETGVYYEFILHLNYVFRFKSSAVKPVTEAQYSALRSEISAAQGTSFITISTAMREKEGA